MKKYLVTVFIMLGVFAYSTADAQTKFRAFTALTGGGTGAIDKIPIAELTDGDIAFTTTASYFYVHRFVAAATDAESSPTYIRPDDYATAGVWTLMGLYGSSLLGGPSATPSIVLKDSDATDNEDNIKIYANCTDVGPGASEDCDIYIQTQTAGTLTTRVTIDGDGGISFDSSVTAVGSFIIGSADLNETDLEKLDGITNGTQAANKAVVADANVNTGVSKVTELHIGASGSEVQVTATAAELNYNDIASLGTGAASKAVVLDGSGNYTAPAGAWDLGGATSFEIPNGTDPNVDAAGEITFDTDGANITGDASVRGYDGSAQVLLARKLHDIHVTVVKPQDMADAVRDAFLVWSNETGMTFTVTQIKAWAGTDDTTLNVEETDADGANNATIDALEIATNGTGVYTVTETTITGATIEAGHLIWLDFDDTDDPAWVKVTITGWFNADVD